MGFSVFVFKSACVLLPCAQYFYQAEALPQTKQNNMFRIFIVLLGTLGTVPYADMIESIIDSNLKQMQSILLDDYFQHILGKQLYQLCYMDPEMAVSLIDEGNLQVNAPDRGGFGFTALHHAAGDGNVPVVKLLLLQGATVEAQAKGRLDITPLFRAAMCGQLDVVKLLVTEWGANPEAAANSVAVANLGAVAGPESETTFEWLQAVTQQRKEVVAAVREVLQQVRTVAAKEIGRLIVKFSHGWTPRHPKKEEFSGDGDPNIN